MQTIEFEDFARVELRVGTVIGEDVAIVLCGPDTVVPDGTRLI